MLKIWTLLITQLNEKTITIELRFNEPNLYSSYLDVIKQCKSEILISTFTFLTEIQEILNSDVDTVQKAIVISIVIPKSTATHTTWYVSVLLISPTAKGCSSRANYLSFKLPCFYTWTQGHYTDLLQPVYRVWMLSTTMQLNWGAPK